MIDNLLQKVKQMAQWQPNANGVGENMGPFYREPGLFSVGGKTNIPFTDNYVGGTLGIDNNNPFMSVNYNGKGIETDLQSILSKLLGK